MEKLDNILQDTEKALMQLNRALQEKFSDIVRDAAIQRFEFTFELFWKLVKTYLNYVEGIDCYSPKNCFRELLPILLASEDEVELLLKMCDHRNLISHVHDEEISNEVFNTVPSYYNLMYVILSRIKAKYKELHKKHSV
ncbi:MAG: HI0074 family nucleotidyltransferase substrate-binding subunit [Bacteroidota bacterium]|nr:HI0074 family nucleotidyltransferase substrate-binding subunit [Bacteroidota bacterium]